MKIELEKLTSAEFATGDGKQRWVVALANGTGVHTGARVRVVESNRNTGAASFWLIEEETYKMFPIRGESGEGSYAVLVKYQDWPDKDDEIS